MNKWTRRAFIGTGILAGGAAVVGIAIRPGNRAGKMKDLLAKDAETLINIWIKIGLDNIITVYVPHAEMGQGVHTSLAMMLADELDADWNKIKIEEAPSNKEYASGGIIRGFVAEGTDYPAFLQDTMNGIFNTIGKVMNMELTGGSASVRFTGKYVMRIAGAAAKEMIKQAASEEWKVPLEEIKTENSMVSHLKTKKTETYAHFAPSAVNLKMPVQPKLKERADFKIMGTSPQRNDIPAKVNGTAQFGIDTILPNMKYATIKASPVFGANIKNIDESGVTKRANYQKIINLGNAVAVVSEGYWLASQTLKELKITFETSPNDKISTAEIFESFAEALKKTDDFKKDIEKGDVEKSLNSASKVIEQTYKVPFLAHTAMEPMNCTIWLQKDKCEVWIGCQNPLGIQKAVADIVDMGMDQVHVYNQYLGGGFGRKSETDIAVQAAKIAKEVDFPLKFIWSREEDVQQDKYRDASISKFKAAIDETGKVVAWQNFYTFKNHPKEASLIPYLIENQHIAHVIPKTHIPWGNWRSVDASKHGFFIESFIDELAHSIQKDPIVFRNEMLLNQPKMQKVLALAAEKSGWGTELPKGKGRGVSLVESFGTIVAEVAEVCVSEEGQLCIDKITCVADAGFVMHPDGFIAQMESGIVFGLTAALYGEINIVNGAVKESNFHDYQMLRIGESPAIETYILNSEAQPGGAGEPSTPGIAPAVCNAIYAATGIRVRELPIKNHDLSMKNWTV
ncbi:xanthine dehydrogenase family protein molybdopterin-binding subunit [Lacihabitans sp. LS3-19]|uniref:xanthine dehydrogenase family protein molybdopterin-binding subunit n=1 Tax=Lacihabitans sp. LS3-19 TaxID=2487335 RepID=UPI0020CCCFDE|nr:molybdopterin cofactor-binding domain-containing protein [Lacihabitans sp. LS3-19]MCP9770499.1 xanthine dehydrogenase family protein molybdopterin-binding subunit [Lacihabitans sp. LS3-19]